ncbi:hypothetical protein PR003_g2540 [Phytophthora rubi]|uniref:RING-type domain-containing protein n=2 Tax=Phytophthora rubi TaxID=129364 RepID=A0A6A4FXZ5_9STRA|nr:hypothetical protein PR003_g2540 [Phytophthora rubi]
MAPQYLSYGGVSDVRSRKSGQSGDDVSSCVICLEQMGDGLAALPCGHVFHHICLEQALARYAACPICRREASPRDRVRLYLSLGASDADRGDRVQHGSSPRHDADNCNFSKIIAAERLREMKTELDRANDNQRLLGRHSHRLQSKLERQAQQLEQTEHRLQHIQRDLDSANVQLKRWQRIAELGFHQSSMAKAAHVDLEVRVQATADRMLKKVRAHEQQVRCSSCRERMTDVERAVLAFASAAGPAPRSPCCQRHHRPEEPRATTTRRPEPSRRRRRGPYDS